MPSTYFAEWILLNVCWPGGPAEPAGILLLDYKSNCILFKLKPYLNHSDQAVMEVWSEMEEDLRTQSERYGAAELIIQLERTLSNVFRLSERRLIETESAVKALEALYSEHVEH